MLLLALGLMIGAVIGYVTACLMFVIVNDDYDNPEKLEKDKED